MSESEAGDPWISGRDVSDQLIHDSQYGHLHLRDFFAAFGLMAVVGLDLEEATHESDAAYAYAAADAMLAQREKRNGSQKPE